MAEECKSTEMTREEKEETTEKLYCSWDEAVSDKLYKDYIRNTKCEIKTKEIKTQEAKADAGKAPITLVPMEIVWAIAWIRKYGNEKYGDPDNWKTVEPERYRDALMRHLLYYISDPTSVDKESGYPHLWHAACNMAFLMHMDYGGMCHYDFAVKSPEWEKIGKVVENNRISPSDALRKLGDYFATELKKQIENANIISKAEPEDKT